MAKKIAAVVLLLCLLGGVSCAPKEEEDKAEAALAHFIELWGQGEYKEMYGCLSAEARSAWSEEEFATRYAKISAGIGLQGVKLVDVAAKDASLQYSLNLQTSTVGNFRQDYTIQMVQEGKEWRLNWKHGHILPGLTSDLVVRVTRQMPKRGSILDRNNQPLAEMAALYNVGLIPGQIESGTVEIVATLLEKPAIEVERALSQSWVREDTFVPIATINPQTWNLLLEPLSILRGVVVRETPSRVYSIPESLAQTVGYVGEIEAKRLEKLSALGFQAGDIVGRDGLELVYDQVLAGQPGWTITIRDRNSNVVSTVASRDPVQGKDVVTCLDLAKSRILDTALGDRTGSILMLDFASGELLAVISKPGFDSDLFAQGIAPEQYNQLMQMDAPLINRAFNGLYPPGSVFKPFTALMALEEGVFDPGYSWDTPRQWQGSPDWGAYQVTRVVRPLGPVDLWGAMRWSDNVYFADLGVKVGWPAFEGYGSALGFGSRIPLAMTGKQSQLRKKGSGEVLLADSSYGQGEMLVTPLHIALMYAAIARQDGTLPVPRLNIDEPEKDWLTTGFSGENLELVDRVLAYAASDQDALAWVGSDTVRGKTGTSEISKDRQIAWYICYFDNYVLAVTIEGDRSLSSTQAVSVARECLSGIR